MTDSLVEFLQKSDYNDKSIEMFKALIDSGANINDCNGIEKITPLFFCVANRQHQSWIPLLLNCGADPSLEDLSFVTTSDIAWQNKDYEVVVQLILAGGPCPKNTAEEKLDPQKDSTTGAMLTVFEMFHKQIQKNKQIAETNISASHLSTSRSNIEALSALSFEDIASSQRNAMFSMENSSSLQTNTAEKRKASNLEQRGFKQRKYSSLIEFIKSHEPNEDSQKELIVLLNSFTDFDVNDWDAIEERTPLLYCIEKKLQWVPLLLENGADPSLTEIIMPDGTFTSAPNFAWEIEKYDIVCQLITADGPYPHGFNWEEVTSVLKSKTEKWSNMVQAFHTHIKNDDRAAVEKFVYENKKTKYAYNLNNKCALLTALEMNTSGMYEFLLSQSFVVGIMDLEAVKNEIRRHFAAPNVIVFGLVSKSRLGPNNKREHFKDVIKCFEALNEIHEMKFILQLLESSKDVTIIFDFNRENICGIDPVNPHAAEGRTYAHQEKILIAAQRKNYNELLGTLSHELTHFVLHLLYNNEYRPYYENDLIKQDAFDEVVEQCSKARQQSEIVSKVYENYDTEDIHAELIVRVPQLIVLNASSPNKLVKLREQFKLLFEFFQNYVIPDMKTEVELIDLRKKTRDFNTFFGLYRQLSSTSMRCNSQTYQLAEINTNLSHVFVETKTPDLTMASLIANLENTNKSTVDSKNIFAEIKQLHDNSSEDTVSLFDLQMTTFYILDSNLLEIEKAKHVLSQYFPENRVVFVTNKSYKNFEEIFPHINGHPSIDIMVTSFLFANLTEIAKSKLLDSMTSFQNKKVYLKNIIPKHSKMLQDLAVEELFNFNSSERDVFASSLSLQVNTVSNVFIERGFEPITNPENVLLDANNILSQLMKKQCIILADLAGMGKTTSALKFAENLVERNIIENFESAEWVVFLDLKQHISVYIPDTQYMPSEIEPIHFGERLLGIKNKFEKKLFEEFFNGKKVCFILDGFDEISPLYKKFILNMTKLIKESGNGVLVTTRTHLTTDLVNELATPAIKLRPFSEKDQENFLRNFWMKKFSGTRTAELAANLEAKAKNLLEKFQESLKRRDFVEVPLQLYMMAEVFDETSVADVQMNLFSLYKQFVNRKIQIWTKKGLLAEIDNTEIQSNEATVCLMHQEIAFEYIFGKSVSMALELSVWDEILNKELITRIGLIKIALGSSFEFVHKTYAEFLIADYCFNKIFSKENSDKNVEVFVKVFFECDYENIRKFMNEKLKTGEGKKLTALKWSDLAVQLSKEEDFSLVSQLVSENLVNLAVYVLESQAINNQAKLILVKRDHQYLGSSLQVATENLETFSVLWNCIKSFATEHDQKDLLLSKIGEQGSILEQAFHKNRASVLKFVLEALESLLNKIEFRELVTLNNNESYLLNAAKKNDEPVLEIFWSVIVKKLDAKDQKSLLYGSCDGVLAKLINDSRGIFFVLKIIKKEFKPHVFRHFLKGEDWFVDVLCFSAFFSSAECFSAFWAFVEDQFLDKKDRKYFLITKFGGVRNALVTSCCNKNTSTMQRVFFIARDVMSVEEFRVELTTMDGKGLVAFHHAFLNGKHIDYVKAFYEIFKVKIIDNEIRQFLKTTFPSGENITHLLNTTVADKKIVWNSLLRYLDVAEVKKLILMKGYRSYNMFASAFLYEKPFVIDIFEWFKMNSNTEETEMVFTEKADDSFTLLHLVSMYRNESFVQTLIDFLLSCKFDSAVLKRILLAEDYEQNFPLFSALCNKHHSTVRALWNVYYESFEGNELKALIVKHKSKILHWRSTKNEKAVELLIKLANEKFSDVFQI